MKGVWVTLCAENILDLCQTILRLLKSHYGYCNCTFYMKVVTWFYAGMMWSCMVHKLEYLKKFILILKKDHSSKPNIPEFLFLREYHLIKTDIIRYHLYQTIQHWISKSKNRVTKLCMKNTSIWVAVTLLYFIDFDGKKFLIISV